MFLGVMRVLSHKRDSSESDIEVSFAGVSAEQPMKKHTKLRRRNVSPFCPFSDQWAKYQLGHHIEHQQFTSLIQKYCTNSSSTKVMKLIVLILNSDEHCESIKKRSHKPIFYEINSTLTQLASTLRESFMLMSSLEVTVCSCMYTTYIQKARISVILLNY